jgi:hypothetical protein
MYSVASYFVARTSIEIFPTFLCSLGLALICFWMIGQNAAFACLILKWLQYLGLISCACASSLGLYCSIRS